ncbi:hypothetical protein LR48_Vigan10g147900 [Vigna angularis]|uniref:Uncharacterized protein n=1 Tax=Phaseolus angularis TaxID=3914 RepID=A0A0L9VL18_PHAAN|nr:hypothetical protein LR48_Vigan10g147900 [Vigna angularis]
MPQPFLFPNNHFSGEFPRSSHLPSSSHPLGLSSNNFIGQIPFSVNNLTHLTGLFLEHNARRKRRSLWLAVEGLQPLLPGSSAVSLLQFDPSHDAGACVFGNVKSEVDV